MDFIVESNADSAARDEEFALAQGVYEGFVLDLFLGRVLEVVDGCVHLAYQNGRRF